MEFRDINIMRKCIGVGGRRVGGEEGKFKT